METLKHRLEASRREEDGFTLIELMVVVLIIAILLAIAIPTFLGAQNKAKDRSAQSSLRSSVNAAKTVVTDNNGDYTKATPAALLAVEPSLDFKDSVTASTDPKVVSVNTPSSGEFYAAAISKTGTCFYIRDTTAAGVNRFAKSSDSAVACTGEKAADASVTWSDSW